ncbi:Formiminoglutamate deiminase [metagenome]|uniref:Formiminoglutamate deiminase n=1 Tax=metagenome TaxID=256318 RepID=A0A2P2BZT0_9ZZZZ
MTAYLLERALLPSGVADDVLVTVDAGVFTSVQESPDIRGNWRLSGVATPDNRGNPRISGETCSVPGLTIPGLANCHSHAFHRALRGRTQRERGTFWTWREQMYAVAARLTPDTYFELALATYREMVATGITSVGEFHYLHHQPDGQPYDDPNVLGRALIEAAKLAGLRITLLDTCYLAAGIGQPPEGVQRRFDDGSGDAWAARVQGLTEQPHARIGSAIHSVRAVPRDAIATVAAQRGPLHVHLSEQRAENDQCLAAYGLTPTELLEAEGALGERTSVVHATHLTDTDIATLGAARAFACFCPTTERDLGDGVGPSRRLHEAGSRLTLGSDSHAVIDLFEEMRAVELDERLATEQRGHWSARELLQAATTTGQASLGWPDAGSIAVGQRADLVTLDTSSLRTAGTGRDENTAVFAAAAGDITQVVVDGRVVLRQGDGEQIGRQLDAAIGKVWA